jgi:hypothetical protein
MFSHNRPRVATGRKRKLKVPSKSKPAVKLVWKFVKRAEACSDEDLEGIKDCRDKIAEILDVHCELKTYSRLVRRLAVIQQRLRNQPARPAKATFPTVRIIARA